MLVLPHCTSCCHWDCYPIAKKTEEAASWLEERYGPWCPEWRRRAIKVEDNVCSQCFVPLEK